MYFVCPHADKNFYTFNVVFAQREQISPWLPYTSDNRLLADVAYESNGRNCKSRIGPATSCQNNLLALFYLSLHLT